MRKIDFLDPKDLVVGKIYGRTGYGSVRIVKPVYIVEVFKGVDFHKICGSLPRTTQVQTSPCPPQANATCVVHLDLRNPNAPYEIVVVDINRDTVGYVEPSKKLLEDLKSFVKRTEVLTSVAKVVKKTIADGFPTILDELAELIPDEQTRESFINGLADKPRLTKLIDRIDESLD